MAVSSDAASPSTAETPVDDPNVSSRPLALVLGILRGRAEIRTSALFTFRSHDPRSLDPAFARGWLRDARGSQALLSFL